MNKLKHPILWLLLSTLSISVYGQLQNGDFESITSPPALNTFLTVNVSQTNVTTWTISNSAIDVHGRNHWGMGGEGNFHIDLNATGQISQTLNLTPQSRYCLTFITNDHSLWQSGSCSARVQIGNDLSAQWTRNFGETDSSEWVAMTFSFVATTANPLLSFTGLGSSAAPGGILIDDVRIFECLDPCFAEIDIDTIGCDLFDFELITPNIPNVCSILVIDGTVIEFPVLPIHLDPGFHEICFSYLGFDTMHRLICCDSICRTIEVLGIDTIADTLSYCDFEFSLGYPFNPCTTYPGYSSYQINSGPVSPCPGGTIFLPSGNYVVRYWSADNCLRLVVNLNITANEVDSLECEREIIIPCEGPMWAAELLSPEMGTGDCDCDYELGDDLEGNVISITQIQDGITKVVKEFKNHTKCNYCLVEFTIIEERCNFNVEFNYTSGSGVGQIPIWRTEPNLPCGTETYTLYDENHNILDTRTHSPAWPIGQVDNFTITQPGGYTIVLEVCNCVCEQACCRKDSVFFQIFEEGGSFTILRMGLFEESGNSGFESQTIAGDSSRLEIILIPNPSSRVFTIGNNSGQELVYEDVIIINSEGKAIKRLENQSSSSLIDMGETPAGEYVVFAKFNGFYYSAKLILIN